MPRKVADAEKSVSETIKILSSLLHASPVPKRGTVLADILYRDSHGTRPDGYGNASPGARSAPT